MGSQITTNIVHIYNDESFNKSLGEAIEKKGFRFNSFMYFDDVIEILEENEQSIDLIAVSIEDYTSSMLDFFKQIKVHKKLPIIALASTKESISLKSLMKFGFNDYISKESSFDEIAEEIIDYIKDETPVKVNLENTHVAVIDDDVLQLRILQTLFMGRGINNIETYLSAEEFLKNPKEFDLFLVDIVLDKMSGIKLVKKIRDLYPKSLIIVISSVDDNRIITTAFDKGADDFIKKPIEREVFVAKVFNRLKN